MISKDHHYKDSSFYALYKHGPTRLLLEGVVRPLWGLHWLSAQGKKSVFPVKIQKTTLYPGVFPPPARLAALFPLCLLRLAYFSPCRASTGLWVSPFHVSRSIPFPWHLNHFWPQKMRVDCDCGMSWIMRYQLGSEAFVWGWDKNLPEQPGKEEEVEIGKVTDWCRAAQRVGGTRVSSLYPHSTPSLSSHSTHKTTVLLGYMHAEAQFSQKELFQDFSMSSPCSIAWVLPHLWPHTLHTYRLLLLFSR